MEFEHEKALTDNNVSAGSLPRSLKAKINNFNQQVKKVYADPNNVNQKRAIELTAYSAVIADEIQDFVEKDLQEANEQEIINQQKTNSMAKQTKYAHETLLNESGIKQAELTPCIQDLLTKFAAETDQAKKDAMDEKLYGMIEDLSESKQHESEKAAKAEKKAKETSMDVSSAGTAKTEEQKAAETAAAAPKQTTTKSPLKTIFGR